MDALEEKVARKLWDETYNIGEKRHHELFGNHPILKSVKYKHSPFSRIYHESLMELDERYRKLIKKLMNKTNESGAGARK